MNRATEIRNQNLLQMASKPIPERVIVTLNYPCKKTRAILAFCSRKEMLILRLHSVLLLSNRNPSSQASHVPAPSLLQ